MYLMRQLTDLSLAEIGRVFGGRDHTTVLYACEKIGERINSEGSIPREDRRFDFHAGLGMSCAA